jgi:hypothetical protein
MSRIRGKNTTPEKRVRSLLLRLGYRFRLHVRIPLSASTGEGQGEVSNSARRFCGYSSSETQDSRLRSRLLLAPTQGLQELHHADEPV